MREAGNMSTEPGSSIMFSLNLKKTYIQDIIWQQVGTKYECKKSRQFFSKCTKLKSTTYSASARNYIESDDPLNNEMQKLEFQGN